MQIGQNSQSEKNVLSFELYVLELSSDHILGVPQ